MNGELFGKIQAVNVTIFLSNLSYNPFFIFLYSLISNDLNIGFSYGVLFVQCSSLHLQLNLIFPLYPNDSIIQYLSFNFCFK